MSGDQRSAAAEGEPEGGIYCGPFGAGGDTRCPEGPGQAGDPVHRQQRSVQLINPDGQSDRPIIRGALL